MTEQATDGGRKPRVTDQEILEVFREHRDPVLSTAEVADQLPIKRRGTLNRLRRLEEEGEVISKQIGGRNTVWWLTDRARPLADPGPENDIAASGLSEPSDRPKSGDDASMEASGGPSSGSHPGGNAGETGPQETDSARESLQDAETDDIRRAISEVDFPSGRDRQQCIEAILAARDHLRENGPASMRELVAEVMPDHPLGYEVPEIEDEELVADRYRGAWWRKVVRPGLKACEDVQPATGGGDYRYTDEEER
jgi:hypothetical protein